MRKRIFTLLVLISVGLLCSQVIRVDLPKTDTVTLTPYATFALQEIDESSAIVKSRITPDTYWTLNDSGDKPRIFPIRRDGTSYVPEWAPDAKGLEILDAVNIDWEDMACDNDGNLYIGAFGNNGSARRDLAVYVVREPHPLGAVQTRHAGKIDFRYPDQTQFPPEKRNFDCEALFWAQGKLYVLSKHRADKNTTLYCFDSMSTTSENVLTKIADFEIDGQVTAADCSEDGAQLAILTYNNVWVFSAHSGGDWFHGSISWLPIAAKQCEAICFDGDNLLITNEQKELFELPVKNLIKVK